MLGRSATHRLGRRGPPGNGHQGRVQPVPTDEGLRRSIGRFEQPELPLEPGKGEHPVVAQGRRELLGGESVDLVPAVGDEVEHEPQLPELLGKLPHLVVAQPGRIPIERWRQVVREHLLRILVVDRQRESPGVVEVRGLRLHPQQVGERSGSKRLGDRIVDPTPDLVVALRRLGQLRIPGDGDAERIRLLTDLGEGRAGLRRRRHSSSVMSSCPPSPTSRSRISATASPYVFRPASACQISAYRVSISSSRSWIAVPSAGSPAIRAPRSTSDMSPTRASHAAACRDSPSDSANSRWPRISSSPRSCSDFRIVRKPMR